MNYIQAEKINDLKEMYTVTAKILFGNKEINQFVKAGGFSAQYGVWHQIELKYVDIPTMKKIKKLMDKLVKSRKIFEYKNIKIFI